MIFLIPLLLLACTILIQSNKLGVWFFISLVFSIVYALLPKQKLINLLSIKLSSKVIRIAKIIFVTASIFLLVKSAYSHNYFLGGDDSRLFYIYPEKYIENFVLNTKTNIGPGSVANILPPMSILPFATAILFIKTLLPFLNIQSVLYSLNLIFGMVFFYKLISYLYSPKLSNTYIKAAFSIASFMYVFSIYNAYILYNAKLLSIYLVSTFPLCIYLFIKSVRESKKAPLILIAIIFSLFSYFAVILPWAAGLMIVVFPIIIASLWEYKKRLFTNFLILIVLFTIFNLHWLLFVSSTSIMFGSSSLTSGGFRLENAEGIRSTAFTNRVFYPLFNLFHYNIQVNFNWAFLTIFKSWYLKILPFNFLFFFIITLALIIAKKTSKHYKLYLGSVISFVLAIYFYNVHFGILDGSSWGVDIFTWLNIHIPGFVIFRNMYDKFAPAMAFTYSLIFGLSLSFVLSRIRSNKIKNIILLISGLVVLLNAKPILLNEFDNTPVWSTKNIYNKMHGLDPNYLSATDYISTLPSSTTILNLPLAYGNVSIIKDSGSSNNFYLGVSPMLFLSGKNDYPGIMSFGTDQQKIRDLFFDKKYSELHKLINKYNIDYVLVLNELPDELQKSYLFYPELYELQNSDYKNQILGEEVARFGNSYTLYKFKEINE